MKPVLVAFVFGLAATTVLGATITFADESGRLDAAMTNDHMITRHMADTEPTVDAIRVAN